MFPYELSLWQCRKKLIICLELWLVTAAADFILRLTQIPTTRYQLWLILFCGLLEFRRLDTGYSWFHHTAGSSSSGWIRVAADCILWLTPVPVAIYELQLIATWDWLRVTADSILRSTQDPLAGFDLRLTYTLIYPVNLKTYSPNYIIF